VAEWRCAKGNRKKERLTTRASQRWSGGGGGDATITNTTAITGCVRFPRARVVLLPPPPRFILPLRLCFTRVAAVATAIAEEEADGALEPLRGESSILPPTPPPQPYPTCAPSRDTLAACAKYFSSPSQSAARRARVCPRTEWLLGQRAENLELRFRSLSTSGKSGFAPLERKAESRHGGRVARKFNVYRCFYRDKRDVIAPIA